MDGTPPDDNDKIVDLQSKRLERIDDNRAWTIEEMLGEAIKETPHLREEGFTSCMVVFLHDEAPDTDGIGSFRHSFLCSNMRASQVIALAEVLKIRMLQAMNYIDD